MSWINRSRMPWQRMPLWPTRRKTVILLEAHWKAELIFATGQRSEFTGAAIIIVYQGYCSLRTGKGPKPRLYGKLRRLKCRKTLLGKNARHNETVGASETRQRSSAEVLVLKWTNPFKLKVCLLDTGRVSDSTTAPNQTRSFLFSASLFIAFRECFCFISLITFALFCSCCLFFFYFLSDLFICNGCNLSSTFSHSQPSRKSHYKGILIVYYCFHSKNIPGWPEKFFPFTSDMSQCKWIHSQE